MAEKDSGDLYGDAHVASYRETGGEYGHLWRGAPTLLLTTKGAKSGKERTMALIYGRSGDDYLLVASNGGSTDHPQWFKNLTQDPEVELQVRDEVFPARARVATEDEKPAKKSTAKRSTAKKAPAKKTAAKKSAAKKATTKKTAAKKQAKKAS